LASVTAFASAEGVCWLLRRWHHGCNILPFRSSSSLLSSPTTTFAHAPIVARCERAIEAVESKALIVACSTTVGDVARGLLGDGGALGAELSIQDSLFWLLLRATIHLTVLGANVQEAPTLPLWQSSRRC